MTEKRIRRLSAILGAMATLWALLEVLGSKGVIVAPLALWRGFGLVTEPFMAAALIGTVLIYLLTDPKRGEVLLLVTVALLLLGVALLLQRHGGRVQQQQLAAAFGSFLGLSSLLMLALRALRRRGEGRRSALHKLLSGAVLPGFVMLSLGFLQLTVVLHPRIYDGYLYAADLSLGLQPNLLVHRLFLALPAAGTASMFVYGVLPLALAVLYALESHGDAPDATPPIDTLLLFVLAGAAGFTLYHAFPVIGPRFLFHPQPPDRYPALAQVPLAAMSLRPEPRNCMPSLHTSWALLLWWQSSFHRPWVRAAAAAFLGFTVLATLGFGFHYLWDLIVAVPFSLGIWAACAETLPLAHPARCRALVLGLMLCAALMALLRFGLPLLRANVLVPWALGGAALLAALSARGRLLRAISSSSCPSPASPAATPGTPPRATTSAAAAA